MESLNSFPVGLFHPLQHAGLSRRSTCSRLIVQVTFSLPLTPTRLCDPLTSDIRLTEFLSTEQHRPRRYDDARFRYRAFFFGGSDVSMSAIA